MPQSQYQLSDHDKHMLAVAENGHPLDPSENLSQAQAEQTAEAQSEDKPSTSFELPEGFESYEALVEAATKAKAADAEKTEEVTETPEATEETETTEEAEAEDAMSDAERELREIKVYEAVGGKEKYSAMAKYAADNLSEAELDVYNAAVNGKDPSIAMFATRALKAMHSQYMAETHGTQGQMTLPDGNTSVPASSRPFANQSEMMAAMADPRYRYDAAYNAQVGQRVALSNF